MCGAYPCKAEEVFQVNTDYNIFIPTSETYRTASMPPNTFYPNMIYSHTVHLNVTCGNAIYQFGQEISTEQDGIYTNVLETKLSGGNNAGQISSYTEEFVFMSDTSDTWESKFYFESKLACTGTITLYAYKNNTWVLIESQNYTTYYNYDDIEPSSGINGWKYVVQCNLNRRFTFFRYDNLYADGYTLNQFTWSVRSSQQQAEDTQNKIEENTRQTNGILGTIKAVIDDIVDKIEDTIDAIAELPNTIMEGLKSLFIPTDFYGDLQSGLEDILDSLGVIGYPITYYIDTLAIIRDTSTESMAVEIPAFYWQDKVIFPRYYRSNIFYFKDVKVFQNVQKTAWLRNFFSSVGINIDTVTIGEMVKTFMGFALFFGLIGFVIRMYNSAFGTDMEDESDDN